MKPVFKKETDTFLLEVTTPPDKLKLFLSISPKSGPLTLARDEVLAILQEGLSLEGIDTGVIDAMLDYLAKGEKALERRIKKGREAEPGKDGKIVLLVKKFTGKGDVVQDEKSSNLHSLHLFDNISVGQVVARIYPPKEGKNGIDVFNGVIQSKPGKPVKYTLGDGVSLDSSALKDEGYEKVVSTVEGLFLEQSGELSVADELSIRGDLDFHFGSIDFIGKVKIAGSVFPGFGVKAKKGVTIQGDVRESPVVSPQGDIEVKGFFFGGKGGSAVTGGHFLGSVIQQARVEAGKSIHIGKESVDCVLRSQEGIVGEHARIMGGSLFVVRGVFAAEIGNAAGLPTIIHLCNSIEVSPEYSKLLVQIEEHEKVLKLLDLHLGPLANNPSRVKFLNPPHREKMEKLLTKREQVHKSHQNLLVKKKNTLEQGLIEEKLLVSYKERFYPGVKVLAGEEVFEVKEPLQGPGSIEFNPKEKKFNVGEFQTFAITEREADDKAKRK